MRSGCSIIHDVTADNFLEWKKPLREKETDTLSRPIGIWPSPKSSEMSVSIKPAPSGKLANGIY